MKNFLIILIFFTQSSYAKVLTKKLNVLVLNKEQKSSNYKVLFKQKAAIYTSSKKHYQCLKFSIDNNKQVLVRWDINSLEVTGCKTKKKAK